jgi:intracellular septation protein
LAAILAIGLAQGRSYLAYVMSEMIPLKPEGWMLLTRRLTAFFVFLAVLNEVIWRTLSTDTWVKIETFGFPVLMFLFLWTQIVALQKYSDEAE